MMEQIEGQRHRGIKAQSSARTEAQRHKASKARGLSPLLLCAFAPLCLLLAGCVPLTEEALRDMAPQTQANEPPYTGLGPGYKTYETAHFLVKAYGNDVAVAYSVLCEQSYARIMNDLGLYSFAPARPYNIVVYKDPQEYREKTGQPSWSGGVAYGNAILVYESEGAAAVLAHEMTHLIFNEFMGLKNSADLKWINEGIAVYEETRASSVSKAEYNRRLVELVTPNPIPFSQLLSMAPPSASEGSSGTGTAAGQEPDLSSNTAVERWYAQAGSVASFMINEGGTLGFSTFISRIKAGDPLDAAISAAFSGLWRNFADTEKAWLLHIRG